MKPRWSVRVLRGHDLHHSRKHIHKIVDAAASGVERSDGDGPRHRDQIVDVLRRRVVSYPDILNVGVSFLP